MKMVLCLTTAVLLNTAAVFAEESAPPPAKPRRPEMTAEQKADAEQKLNEEWSKLPVEGKIRLMRLNRALREMPPQDRRFVHDRVERFLNMSPEERDRLRQNREKWEKMTAEERDQARQEFRKHREEFDKKWREEHPGEEPPPFRPRAHRPSQPPVDKLGEEPPPPPTNEPNQ